MVAKKDEYDEDEGDESPIFFLNKLTIFTAIILIILCELFLYLLSAKTSSEFGLAQIFFALISGVVITLFLIWIRFMMVSNRFLASFISIVGISAVSYAITRKYQGVYTTVFLSIGIVIALSYTIFYFMTSNKK